VEVYLYSNYIVVLNEAQGQLYIGGWRREVMLYLKIPYSYISALSFKGTFVL
jgi:hypothetical protein